MVFSSRYSLALSGAAVKWPLVLLEGGRGVIKGLNDVDWVDRCERASLPGQLTLNLDPQELKIIVGDLLGTNSGQWIPVLW